MFGFVLLFVFFFLVYTSPDINTLLYKILIELDQKPLVYTYDVNWFHDNVKTLYKNSMPRTH
jgi:hypothetical protein